MADGNITKDPAYDAVAPGRFRVDAGPGPLRRALDRLRQDHLARPTTISGIRSTRNTSTSPSPSTSTKEHDRCRRSDRRACRSATSATRWTKTGQKIKFANAMTLLVVLVDPAWRAGRAEPLGLALPHAEGPGRAGIRRQPDARGSPPRHRLRQIHQGALGQAACPAARCCRTCWSKSSPRRRSTRRSSACRCWSRASPWAPSPPSIKDNQRSAGAQALPAGDDRRGLPPQVREDLGRPHHPEAVRGRARTWSRTGRRSASRCCCSTSARRSRRRGSTTTFGLDPAGCSQAFMEAITDADTPRGHAGSDQHLPRADQDAAQGRHHHRPHQGASMRTMSTWTS